jgi:hypothetical protein
MAYNTRRLSVIFLVQTALVSLGCVPCLAQDLAGKWEGTYSESRRVIVFAIDFESETKGTLQILGTQTPILAKRSEAGSVEIRTEGNDPTFLSGHHGNLDALIAQSSDTSGPFSFDRGPPFELEAELAKEINRLSEVIDDDSYVVHSFERHASNLQGAV